MSDNDSNDFQSVPTVPTHSAEVGGQRDDLVAELVKLSETGEIKYTPKYIKKASHDALNKIKRDYDRKQLDETNEFISDSLISKFSELMGNLSAVDNADDMEKELGSNPMLKKDLKCIIGQITPYIPLIGLVCGGVIVGKHMFKGRKDTPPPPADTATT